MLASIDQIQRNLEVGKFRSSSNAIEFNLADVKIDGFRFGVKAAITHSIIYRESLENLGVV